MESDDPRGSHSKQDEACEDEFTRGVRGNIDEQRKFGLAVNYERYLKEPQVEELPRMQEIEMERFYEGGYVEEYVTGYQPLTSFTSHRETYGRKHALKTEFHIMETLFQDAVQDITDNRSKKTVEEISKVNHVMVVGPAGAGKTTLLRRFANYAQSGKIPQIQRDDVTHMLDGRGFNPEEEIGVLEYLFRNMSHEMSSESAASGFQKMLQHPEKVALVVDSLDTLGYDLDKESKLIGPHDKALPSTILYNIFIGNLFPGCKILSSSREHQIRKYKGKLRPQRIISLAGLTQDSIYRLTLGFMGEEEGKRIYSHLKEKCPDLFLLCQTPVFLVYVLIGFSGKVGGAQFIPSTMTGVMIKLLQSIIHSEHARVTDVVEEYVSIINKMKKLSYDGTMKGKVLFSERDLKDARLSPKEVTDLAIVVPGKVQKTQRVLDGDSITFFSHQSIEEVLCAIHVAEMPIAEFQSFASESLHKPRFSVIRRMLCGLLLDPNVYKEALRYLCKDRSDIAEIHEILLTSMKIQFENVREQDRLELFYSIQEAGEGAKSIVPEVIKSVEFEPSYTSLDLFTVHSAIQHSRCVKKLGVSGCEAFVDFLPNFIAGQTDSSLKISKLDVSATMNMGIEGFFHLGRIVQRCQAKEVHMHYCNIEGEEMREFEKGLGDAEISTFNVSGNKHMGIEGFYHLGRILQRCQVKNVYMRDCNIKTGEIKEFAESLGDAKVDVLGLEKQDEQFLTTDTAQQLLHCVNQHLLLSEEDCCSNVLPVMQKELDKMRPSGLQVSIRDERGIEVEVLTSLVRPSNVKAKRFKSGILVSWDAVDQEDGDVFIQIYRNGKKLHDPIKAEGSEFPFPSPEPSQQYYFEVWVQNEHGEERKALSNTISVHYIGKEKQSISLDGCKVTFPEGSFEESSTLVSISINSKPSDCPRQYIPITALLSIESESPIRLPVSLEMPMWCAANCPKEAETATAFHKLDGHDSLGPVMSLTLPTEQVSETNDSIELKVGVYVLRKEFHFVIRDVNKSLESQIDQDFQKLSAQPIAILNEMTVKPGDKIKVSPKFPESVTSHIPEHVFTIHDAFREKKIVFIIATREPGSESDIIITPNISVNGIIQNEYIQDFTYEWKANTRLARDVGGQEPKESYTSAVVSAPDGTNRIITNISNSVFNIGTSPGETRKRLTQSL